MSSAKARALERVRAGGAYDGPDARGRFGAYGGRYVPETLIAALDELAEAWPRITATAEFRDELGRLLREGSFDYPATNEEIEKSDV